MILILKNQYHKAITLWIILMIILVVSMIIVGGFTRLTDSGLSITKWELFKGIIPPLNESGWQSYFNIYKQTDQYKFLFPNMNLQEFKYIFFWEYIHRLLGRVFGLAFIIPFIYFIYKRIFSKFLLFQLTIIFLLILLQGAIGWFMVSSGLNNAVTVSHYRLSLHLFMAFVILSSLVWVYLNIKSKLLKNFFSDFLHFTSYKIFFILLLLQIIIGAWVSGLDAGRIYQTWPSYNGNLLPSDINFQNLNYIDFKNNSYVQFLHRNLGYIIFLLSIYVGYKIFFIFKKKNWYIPYISVLFLIFTQIVLGILTLVSNLNIYIALMHQSSSILLTLFALNLYYLIQKQPSK